MPRQLALSRKGDIAAGAQAERTSDWVSAWRVIQDAPPSLRDIVAVVDEVFSGHDIETWDDYRNVSAKHLTRVQTLIEGILGRR